MPDRMPDELATFADRFFSEIMAGRYEDIAGRYADTPETLVFVEGPRWATWGADEVAAGWRALGDSPIRLTAIRWTEGPVGQSDGDHAWFGGLVEIDYRTDEREDRIRFRSTHVLTKRHGRWQIVHEHVSAPHPDPYGTGDWRPEAST